MECYTHILFYLLLEYRGTKHNSEGIYNFLKTLRKKNKLMKKTSYFLELFSMLSLRDNSVDWSLNVWKFK